MVGLDISGDGRADGRAIGRGGLHGEVAGEGTGYVFGHPALEVEEGHASTSSGIAMDGVRELPAMAGR